jgi:transposase
MTTGQEWRQLTLTLRTYAVEARKKGFYKAKKTRPRCWWRYDAAQAHEACDVLDSIGTGIDGVSVDLASYLDREKDDRGRGKGRGKGRGRPGKNPSDLAKAVLLQQYVEVSNRPLAGALSLYREKLGIRTGLGYKDVERAYDRPDVVVLVLGLFELSVKAVRDEREFSVDGTGLSTSMKDNWESYLYSRKGKRCRYSVFEKLVCVVGHTYGLVSAFRVLESMHGNESPALRPLVGEVVDRHGGIGLMSGDAAFFSRENCGTVAGVGGVPRLFPKKNASLKSLGVKPYQDMLLSFINDPQRWLEDYFKKAASEWTFSSLKRRYLRPLSREIGSRRRLEVLAKICVYNLIRLSYARWTKDLQAKTPPQKTLQTTLTK